MSGRKTIKKTSNQIDAVKTEAVPKVEEREAAPLVQAFPKSETTDTQLVNVSENIQTCDYNIPTNLKTTNLSRIEIKYTLTGVVGNGKIRITIVDNTGTLSYAFEISRAGSRIMSIQPNHPIPDGATSFNIKIEYIEIVYESFDIEKLQFWF